MLEELRVKHPRFIYESYDAELVEDGLLFTFHFLLEPDIRFAPTLKILGVLDTQWNQLDEKQQHNLAFHLGMAEVLSYWKAAASPEIVVRAGYLDEIQVAWWHNLLIQGMGEYFFVNQIDFTAPEFVTLVVEADPQSPALLSRADSTERVLIPVGGGKDSVVTLEVLGRHVPYMGTLALNASQATNDSIAVSASQETIHVRRKIDPKLLELNAAGYLNGHTPFSSVLAFIAVACGVLFNYRDIALSNESSSNEGNQFFHGHEINHQYSKTFDFETRFQHYVSNYLAGGVGYFSFLRPLSELQIARMFAEFEDYHGIFRSCNVGQKTNSWCHNCPKCLFVYTILYPFMTWEQLSKVFTHDLFGREDLLPLARELAGIADQKPFECVGTHEEVRVAFYLSAQKYRDRGEALPIILQTMHDEVLQHSHDWDERAMVILQSWNKQHAIPTDCADLLQKHMQHIVELKQ